MSGDYVERLRATVALRAEHGTYDFTFDDDDVEAVLDELEKLRASRTSLDGQVFVAGWYAHAEACASLGWDAREAAWRKYREEMAETLAKDAPQQLERDGEADR